MFTVKQVSSLTGLSVRTLHYYHSIGLLEPCITTESGYRLYGEHEIDKIQQILLFRELEFSLKDIRMILDSPRFDRKKALEQQIELLKIKRKHIDELIKLAEETYRKGETVMEFDLFNKTEFNKYVQEAKAQWKDTCEWTEYEQKTKNYSGSDWQKANRELMGCFVEFGKIKNEKADSKEAQICVETLMKTITENFYCCSKDMISSLGKMYVADERFKRSIDMAGGNGTAEFASKAIELYCSNNK